LALSKHALLKSNPQHLSLQGTVMTHIEFFKLRNQSERLLECAKRAVEMAIEQGEKKAIEWLDEQTRAMPHPISPA